MKLVLASKSPRRRKLLAQFGIPFEAIDVDVDENILEHELPGSMTLRLAELKARTGFEIMGGGSQVIGGDTTVALDDVIMGKPENRDHAIAMLRQLSGRTHSVFSAVALAELSGCRSLLSETKVIFRTLSDEIIIQYCQSDDPLDKAGAYGIQGVAGKFVTHLDGSYSGVMGLPLWHVHQLLMGIK